MFVFTVEELIAWFERNFSCVVGWPMSRTGEGPEPTIEEMNARHSSEWPGTFRYEAYGLRAENSERGRAALVQALYRTFAEKVREFPEIKGTRLYWRYPDKISIDGDEDTIRIYTRVSIPCLASRSCGLPVHEEGHPVLGLHVDA